MSISDERGLNFDRNAAILLKGPFLNLVNMKTHFWLLLVIEIHQSPLLSVALPYNIYFYADHRADHCQCLYVRFPGFFFSFSSIM